MQLGNWKWVDQLTIIVNNNKLIIFYTKKNQKNPKIIHSRYSFWRLKWWLVKVQGRR